MAKTKLFEAWSFRLQQPAPFDDPKYAGSKSMGFSQYNTSSTAQKSTLHAPTMRALLAYAKLVSATENGQSVDGLGAIGHQGTTYRISEYRSANKTDCVVFNPVTGKFNAAQVEDGTQALKPYSVGAGNGTGSGLLFCLMPVLNEDDEFRQKFQEFVSLLESGWADMDAAFECALTLCDNVYRRIENSKQLGSDGVKISIPTTGNISVITQMAMDSGNYAPTGASYGEFTIMQMSGTPTAKASSFQKEDFVAKYALSNRTLTARELAMVPTLPDWYIIPKEVVRVCEHAKVTTASCQPMRNFLFRGEAGTGKTMGAQAIAAGLNLPYTLMTCSANTEITDLVGQFIPDTNGFHGSTPIEDLPKISDITMHPPSVYMMLTGEYDEEKTEDDVLQKLIEIAVGNLVEKEETPGQRIRYVDTPLVEAIRHGYTSVNGNVPYFAAAELTTTSFETYSDLDTLGRCGVTYACIGQDLMPTEERGSIGMVKPTGWHTVRYDGLVDGDYLYNRCHLIGYQLTGENANTKNLITGTRYLNIEGMLPFENMVADYIQETSNHVLYRVTPIFEGNNLVANGVLMEGYSVEDKGTGISYCVFAYNVQPSIIIDYATGESKLADGVKQDKQKSATLTPTPSPEPEKQEPTTGSEASQADYILNTNTKKFHYPTCSSVNDMKEKNKQEFFGTRDEAISNGYSPCGRCKP